MARKNSKTIVSDVVDLVVSGTVLTPMDAPEFEYLDSYGRTPAEADIDHILFAIEQEGEAEKAEPAAPMPLAKPTHSVVLNGAVVASGPYPEMVALLKTTPHATMIRLGATVPVRRQTASIDKGKELVAAIETLKTNGVLTKTKAGWKASKGYMLTADDVNIIVKAAAKVTVANQPIAPLDVVADGLRSTGAWAIKQHGVIVGYLNTYEVACAYARRTNSTVCRA